MNRLVSMSPVEKKLGWIYWAFQLLLLPVIIVLLNVYFGAPLTETEVNLLYFGLNFLLLLLIFHKFIFHSCRTGLTRPLRTVWFALIGFILYMICSYIANWAVFYLQPDFVNINDGSIFLMLEENYSITVLGVVILAPIAEELMYRGLIFGALYSRCRILAYLVSALLFAVIHVVGYITVYEPFELLLCTLQYLPAGLFLGWAYARSGSILTPILIHITVNQIAISAMR